MNNFVIEVGSLNEFENYVDFIEKSLTSKDSKKIIIKNAKNTINTLGYPYVDVMLRAIENRYINRIEICIDVGDNAAYAALACEKNYKNIILCGDDILKEKINSIGKNIENEVNILNDLNANVFFSKERNIVEKQKDI